MAQTKFTYSDASSDVAQMPLLLSIFADRAALLSEMRDDADAAGLRVRSAASLANLHGELAMSPADVTVVDCPQPGGADLAALTQLDVLVARNGARLIVSTTLDGLEAVFGCLDQSQPLILVSPSRAERVVALGQALLAVPQRRLRELSEEDRVALLRLTQQVGQLAERLDRMSQPFGDPADDSAFRFESPRLRFTPGGGDGSSRLVRTVRPPLPDPKFIRRMIRQRQQRARFFDGDLFGDPAWDMLLDLTAAQVEHTRVSVTSLCIASGVPPTTALRWITVMVDAGLFQRVEDETDRRRAFITLTDKAVDAMARFFAESGPGLSKMV